MGYVIGVDFGTESARAVLVDLRSGAVVATAVHTYASGVIDEVLPESDVALPPHWALQDPNDWLTALEVTIAAVLSESGVDPGAVVGLGFDFTSCTVLPTNRDGVPLCTLASYRREPHAWPKLWKHHAAQPQAERINALASARRAPWLDTYGGKLSSEWLMPKALELLEGAPHLYAAADRLVEGGDWVVWQLTGRLARNSCAAGYKATWDKRTGFPSTEFLADLHPDLANLYTHKLAGDVLVPGTPVGELRPEWAERLGLPPGVPVAAPIIDAHAGVLGAGVTAPGVLYLAMGTSTCHMLLSEHRVPIEGIPGMVEDGIVPGLIAYEAGQAGVGDIFAWYVQSGVPPLYHTEAAERGISLHQLLSEKAGALRPGQSGLLALDWWNGNRSTLADAELSGLVVGYTLATKPEEVYRALLEATAFGTRVIIEAFVQHEIPVNSLLAGGGLTRNPLLMQIYADVTDREIAVAGSEQASALGAAILAAVAAGKKRGGYDSLDEAVAHLAPAPARVYRPLPEHRAAYDTLYRAYRHLYESFGRGSSHWVVEMLHRLRVGDSPANDDH